MTAPLSPAKDSFMLSKLMKIREPAYETKQNFDADWRAILKYKYCTIDMYLGKKIR
jgi:hypothetical protein